MVHGSWDFLGVLLAVSGVLLVLVPALLGTFYLRTMAEIPPEVNAQEIIVELARHWWLVWAAYYVMLLSGCFLLLWFRRHRTVIYNVDATAFLQVLEDALDSANLEYSRAGASTWRLLPARVADIAPAEKMAVMPGEPRSHSALAQSADKPLSGSGEIEVEPFTVMCNVTLHWRGAARQLRPEVEAELAKRLEDAWAQENPAAGWLLGLSGLLFGFVFLTGVMLILTIYFPRRW
jgi:hypothetical protein